MQYAPPPFNPYTVPAMPLGAASIDATGHRPQVRIFYLLAAAVSALLYVTGLAVLVAGFVADPRHPDFVMVFAGEAMALLGTLFIYVRLGLAMYWLHGAWKWVPMDQRWAQNGKRIGPNDVFLLLIPYYNLYWQFPVNLGLCDAMDRLRQVTRATTVPKRDVAMWAAICEIVPLANFFVAPFLWASYMRSVDVLHDEIATALARGP